jgi:hypothetical protein
MSITMDGASSVQAVLGACFSLLSICFFLTKTCNRTIGILTTRIFNCYVNHVIEPLVFSTAPRGRPPEKKPVTFPPSPFCSFDAQRRKTMLHRQPSSAPSPLGKRPAPTSVSSPGPVFKRPALGSPQNQTRLQQAKRERDQGTVEREPDVLGKRLAGSCGNGSPVLKRPTLGSPQARAQQTERVREQGTAGGVFGKRPGPGFGPGSPVQKRLALGSPQIQGLDGKRLKSVGHGRTEEGTRGGGEREGETGGGGRKERRGERAGGKRRGPEN